MNQYRGATEFIGVPPPLEVQRLIVDLVSRQRARIAEERKAAEARQAQAVREVEEMILGIRPVG